MKSKLMNKLDLTFCVILLSIFALSTRAFKPMMIHPLVLLVAVPTIFIRICFMVARARYFRCIGGSFVCRPKAIYCQYCFLVANERARCDLFGHRIGISPDREQFKI